MLLKKRILEKVRNLTLIFLIIFVLLFSLYFYISLVNKINLVQTSLSIVKDSLTTADVFGSINSNLLGIKSVFIFQLIIFVLLVLSLIFGFWYVSQLYFIESRNSLIDSLTEIYNRRAMMYGLKKEVERSERYKHHTSIAILDLDFFKKYNDSNGHVLGDKLLKRFSKILQKCVRDYDLVGRYGGEEFLLIFPETRIGDAAKICERIRREVENTSFIGMEKMPFRKVTVSIGISSFDGLRKMNPQVLIQKADQFLYRAKETGRNRVVYE